jgi:ABC-type Fe3+-hydroxamate transport system substrate-binding protein
VPSLTEALATVDRSAVVGATTFCEFPADLDVTRVRGTKNPHLTAIMDLAPDVVIANMEENRERDVVALREAGIPVWVTRIERVDEALISMRRMLVALEWDSPDWLDEADAIWAAPPALPALRVAVPIWKRPWMVVGPNTFADDMLRRLGLINIFGAAANNASDAMAPDRYPRVELDQIDRDDVDLVILPDEPYVFSSDDGQPDFTRARTALFNGRFLTWYGPSLVEARAHLTEAITKALCVP